MKKILASSILGAALLAGFALLTLLDAGCVTRSVTTVSPAGVTNTVTLVDTNALALDAAVLEGATAISVNLIVQKDPAVVPALKDAQLALNGVLNGSNAQTTQQVLNLLKAGNNPAVASEVTSLVGVVSSLEQKLLGNYGAEAAGQITIALARAALGGIITGLNSAPAQ